MSTINQYILIEWELIGSQVRFTRDENHNYKKILTGLMKMLMII